MSCAVGARRCEETVITVIRKTVTAAGCAAVLLTSAAACGTVENLTAGQKVDHAVDELGERKSLSLELSLDADPDALADLAGDAEPGEEMPPAFTEFLSGLSVDISLKSRKPLSDSKEKDMVGMSVAIGGSDGVLAEYRIVGDTTYYRSNMQAFGKAMGIPMPSADELPEGEKELRPVVEGDWIKADTSGLKGSARAGASGAEKDRIDAKTQEKVLKAVRGVFAHEVTFKNKGGSDGTEHVVAKANFRALLTGLFDRLQPLRDDLPGNAELPTADELKDAPDKKVAVDFTLKNGDLTRVEVDLAVLAKDAKGAELPLVLTFGKAGDVSAPANAVELPDSAMRGSLNPFFGGMMANEM
ncbi:hypothetical protein ACFY93_02675 [Streptomyces sp. NPDC008313]|uniref:hypothetical protein n=1 Tax=Streptomyces sp. NPDC008313 TaxID=3364826 RepID=UPI0036EBCFAE